MKKHNPPHLAHKLFDWYCGFAKTEDLQGDMEEWFYHNLKTKSPFRAKLIYWKQVISLIASYAIKKRKKDAAFGNYSSNVISFSMFKNYIKVAVRNLARYKYFSIVNAVGLAIGMSIALLMISLYSYVSTYDNFHSQKENIYRIISTREEKGDKNKLASVPIALAGKLKDEYTGIKEIVRINSSFEGEVVLDKVNVPLNGYYVDPNFFSVFSFEMIEGHAASALSKPNTIVLTESAAKKVSSTGDVLGKTLELMGLGIFEVTGIMKDPPKNTHMIFEALVSYSSLPAALQGNESDPERWMNYRDQYVYLLLSENLETEKLQLSLNKISKAVYTQSQDVKASFHLQALADITPGPDLSNSIGTDWGYSAFAVFGTISLLILLPACFNYTNISIARALKRSKEIGLRKTMGGLKNQIFFQFITETVAITLISLTGAILIFMLIRSEFLSMLVEGSALDLSLTPRMAGMFLLFALLTGLFAGVMPALFFAGLNPIQALKSQSNSAFSGMRIRKGLTVFQFALSFCFILSLIVFSRQYRYSLNFDFGFNKENILDVELQGVDPNIFKAEFSKLSSVQNISMSSGLLGLSYSDATVREAGSDDSTEVFQLFVDDRYIENMDLKLLAGKNFPNAHGQQERHVIVNEEFLKAFKIESPVDAIGRTFVVEDKELEVIGVLKNFHFASLRIPIQSFFFRMDPARFTHANLKVTFSDAYASLAQMEEVWNTINNRKFQAKFFDDEIDEAYDYYQTLLKMVGFLGLLAISISLLGLLGMVVYTSETKTKEVGIRKVLGATTMSITVLLSKDYMKLMLWAAGFAIPLTVLLFDKFLSTLQYYRVSLTVWDILASLLLLLIFGLATIASQTLKTASANPAETLKYE